MSRHMQSPPYLEGKKAFEDRFGFGDCPYPLIESVRGRRGPMAEKLRIMREHWFAGFGDALQEAKADPSWPDRVGKPWPPRVGKHGHD